MKPITLFLFALMAAITLRAADLPKLNDPLATPQTVALYRNLHRVGQSHFLFGHQDTLAYGHDWMGEPNRSDVKDVTGDFPAIYGWDMGIVEADLAGNTAGGEHFNSATLLRYVKEAQARGGIVTFSWHARNPMTGGLFNDMTPAVKAILPGGAKHEAYKKTLDAFAEFFKQIAPMPVIFRPFHEHNGDWFWWGKTHASEADYIALWRFTEDYLRDVKGVHNLIYAYSPDRSRIDLSRGKTDYLYGYPGDAYVDVLGLDDYIDVRPPIYPGESSFEDKKQEFVRSLTLLATLADERHKIPALTETGCEKLTVPNWWTERLLPALRANDKTREIAWLMVWRNANAANEKVEHFYVPYKGHPSAPDFVKFHDAPDVLFESELPPMYATDKTAR